MQPDPPTLRRLAAAARLQAFAQEQVGRRRGVEGILRAAEFAGGLAWNSHGGRFVLPLVEAALRDLRVGATVPSPEVVQGLRGRTLHVLTEAYGVGGHTRLVRAWIERMSSEGHAVILVRQKVAFDPRWVVPEGVDVPVFDLLARGMGSHAARAAFLAGCMGEARRVILHIHPDDALTVAAAHALPDVDFRFSHHADHVAWLGAALPATLLNYRQAGGRLAARRRGIPEASMGTVVPLPIAPLRLPDRTQARAALGFRDTDLVLLTLATGYKYLPVAGRSLEAPFAHVLRRPEVQLLAVGPEADHPVFAALAERFPGQVRALGVLADPSLHRAAADVYVDSFPFCSPTSMLESAAAGTPVVSFQPEAEAMEVLYSECPGLPRESYASGEPEGFLDLLEGLLFDARARAERGQAIQAGMQVHLPERWCETLALHLAAKPIHPGWVAPSLDPGSEPLDLTLAGLGADPLRVPKLKRWRVLGLRGPLQVLKERWGSGGGVS
jgi:hypothetical protein